MDDADSAILPLPISKPGLVEASLVHVMPSLIAAAGDRASWRYIDFFTANIRNPNKRRAYIRACETFLAWCEQRRRTLATIRPFDVSAYVEGLTLTHSAPTVKQQLAAIRMLFDWLITGQVVPFNPASAVRGPKYLIKVGKTSALDGKEWRKLLDANPTDTVRDLRDRALIATLTYSFARIGAVLKIKVEDLRPKGAGWQVHLHEKGGRHHIMPCHHELAEALHAYIDAAGIGEDPKGFLFRTSNGHRGIELSQAPMGQPDAWRMIRRRAAVAGIVAPIGNHSFRATGITAYLVNGGALEHAQEMAAHEGPRTTKLYDRTKERLTQDEDQTVGNSVPALTISETRALTVNQRIFMHLVNAPENRCDLMDGRTTLVDDDAWPSLVRYGAMSYGRLLRVADIRALLLAASFCRLASRMFGLTIVLYGLSRFDSPAAAGWLSFANLATWADRQSHRWGAA